jgi:hypothetical protein
MSIPLFPQDIDREQAFMLFTTFAGDCVRTAAALGVSEAAVISIAESEGWLTKLAPIIALKKSTRPGDWDRAINRALNFTQSHRMRLFIQRVITRLTGMNEIEFEQYLFQETKSKSGENSKKLTTRAIADLASALEKAQSMTYLALADTAADRTKRKENEGDMDVSASDLHAQIAAGLAAVRATSSPRSQLFEAQLAQANEIVKQAVKPPSPLDNDNH